MRLPAIALSLLLLATTTIAQERFDLGARGYLALADGEPANDIPGFGLFGHYRMSDRWALGFGVDLTEYDFEQPAKLLGLTQDPSVEVIDAKAEGTTFTVWAERTVGSAWFVGAGAGFASIDVPDARGPLAGGGTFDIATDGGTEIIATVLAGRRFRFGQHWGAELAAHAEQHFADWQIKDRVSGREGSIDDYTSYGAYGGLLFRF
jgi:hypothetical protein